MSAGFGQHRAFLDARVAACANIRTTAQLEDFVVVAELDASGRVTNTWRRGDSPLVLCIERDARGKVLFVPPHAPFPASLEVGLTPVPTSEDPRRGKGCVRKCRTWWEP